MKVTYDEGYKVDGAGNCLEFEGNKVYGVWKNTIHIPTELIEDILLDIRFPVKKLRGIKLFNFPFRLMTYKEGWTGAYYHGRAFATHIVLGARAKGDIPTKESIGAMVVHELGHALMYLACNCTYEDHMESPTFKEYIKLRGIPNKWTPKSIWAKRPAEVFAEDFRFLFGNEYMKLESHTCIEKGWLTEPPTRIKEFMMNLLDNIEEPKQEEEMNTPKKIILHHSATNEGSFNSIRNYHVEVRGWKDIGYHYLIEKDGGLYPGRDEKEVGAHTIGENESSIGICLVGDFDHYEPTKAQLRTLNDLIVDIFDRYGKMPIQRHSDYSSKTCPGINFPFAEVIAKAFINENKNEVSEWAKEAHKWVTANNISDGARPKDKVTREELWTMLWRMKED